MGFHSFTSSAGTFSATSDKGHVYSSSSHADKYQFLDDLFDMLNKDRNPYYVCERWKLIRSNRVLADVR